jgi:hypothetical protein
MKGIRRKRYTKEDGRCCADCLLFTANEYSGSGYPTSGMDNKYGKDIFGVCELTEKNIEDCDYYYCNHWTEGKPYEVKE